MAIVFFAGANETATLKNTFTVNDVPTDPGAISLVVTDPLGVSSTYTYAGVQITKSAVGVYWKEIPTPMAGEWSFQWIGTSPVSDVVHGSFTVLETNLGHLYATPQQMRSRVGLPATDTTNDLELQQACYAASRSIEMYCQRFFWRTLASETRQFEPETFRPMSTSPWAFDPYYAWVIQLGPFNDLVSLASLTSDLDGDGVFETTWASSSYELNPVNNAAGPELQPYTSVRAIGTGLPWFWSAQAYPTRMNRLQITGTFGWPAVPAAITEATRILAAQLFKAKDAPFGVADFGETGAIRIGQNPMIGLLAGPYQLNKSLGAFA